MAQDPKPPSPIQQSLTNTHLFPTNLNNLGKDEAKVPTPTQVSVNHRLKVFFFFFLPSLSQMVAEFTKQHQRMYSDEVKNHTKDQCEMHHL